MSDYTFWRYIAEAFLCGLGLGVALGVGGLIWVARTVARRKKE